MRNLWLDARWCLCCRAPPAVRSLVYLNREGKIHHVGKHLGQGFNTRKQCKCLFDLSKEKVLIRWKYFKARTGLYCIPWMQVSVSLLGAAPALTGDLQQSSAEMGTCFEHEFPSVCLKSTCVSKPILYEMDDSTCPWSLSGSIFCLCMRPHSYNINSFIFLNLSFKPGLDIAGRFVRFFPCSQIYIESDDGNEWDTRDTHLACHENLVRTRAIIAKWCVCVCVITNIYSNYAT